ncbi:MAG: ABC transporter substrate-binding protein [Spirochaetes bacterium]|nr:ABC transporter substrate-binding protein [Spirochaetota bacterium]
MKHFSISFLAAFVFFFQALLPSWSQASSPSLKLGVFADADSLPLMVCESEGIFSSLGADVSLLRFQSAVERDSAFQAGALDGIISDLPAVLLAAQAGFQLGITSLTDGRYGIIAAPNSGAKNLSDLAGKPIGISSNSVIHFMVDSFLDEAGLGLEQRVYLPVPKMPVRLEMVLTGQLAGAGMPEPFLTMARTRGGILLAATDDRGLGAGVLVFSKKVLASKLESIKLLYRAYWTAAQRIDAHPDDYRPLLVEKAGFSPEAAAAFVFVVYKKPRLPGQADIDKAKAWLFSKGLLKRDVQAGEILDPRPIAL